MNLRMTTFLATTAAAALVATGASAQSAAPYPAMSASLAANGTPLTLDLGVLGNKVTVGGVLSGYAQFQSNHVLNDANSSVDLSNAQIFINKSTGIIQYFIQAGTYSLPVLSDGVYVLSHKEPSLTFGNVPTAFVKIVPPTGPFSLQVGELPTLIGDEYIFSFENLNVTRGMLWNVEPAVSRGVQLNYAAGPISASVAWTDGFYSNRFNTISGLATWTINGANTLAVDASIPISKSTTYEETNAAAPQYDNSSVYNVMYTHTMGQWIINPYLQYTSLPEVVSNGVVVGKEETWGAAILVNYAFDSKSQLAGVSLPFRVEFMSTKGDNCSPTGVPLSSFCASGAVPAPNLLYGASSQAWSFTFTPTYQYKNYYIRAEGSYVTASDYKTSQFSGSGYGVNGTDGDQFRGVIETGVLF